MRLKPEELIRFVRKNSPFYRERYSGLPADARLEDLPLLELEPFWKANTLGDNRILTGPMHDGVVFKSGGTTGNPKFSVFSKEEWKVFNESFGRGIASGRIEAGDRVVNLFYVGQLYGSFLFINKSFEECPKAVLQLPVAGSTDFAETMQIIRDFGANVLAGVPTTLMNVAEYIRKNASDRSKYPIKKVLFGGEPFYDDQRERLSEIFPGVEILSIGYASTDAGALGYADRSCGPGEHRPFDEDTVLEILDEETHRPIEEPGVEGLIVVTNLTRTLMPIVRYPSGDRGAWIEPKGTPCRRFRLMGRSDEAARIGLVKLYVQDVRDALERFRTELEIADFQLVVYHRERLDGLIVRIASGKDPKSLEKRSAEIVVEVHRARPLYEEFVRDSKVHPIQVQWVGSGGLQVNPRTGKMKRVVDQRFDGGKT